MFTLRVITCREAFDALEPEWRALEAAGGARTVFQSWPWASAWMRHLGRGARVHTLAFMDWRRTVAIVPLVVQRAYGLPLRRLQWIGTGVSDYLDLLVRPGYEDGVLRELAGYLTSKADRLWDVADLHQIREDSPSLDRLPGRRIPQAVAPYRPLPASIDELHAQFGKKLRGNLRYAARVLEREHAVEFIRASAGDMDREMDAFFDLHARRWRSRWQPGVLFGRAVQAFHRDAARGLLADGALRLHALRLDGETVSSLYCFAYGGVGYYYLGGFQPELSRRSVGTLLTAHALEDAVREGCREFDFLRGREPYNYRWGCVDRRNDRLILAGGGVLSPLSARLLRWEQGVADLYEARAHR